MPVTQRDITSGRVDVSRLAERMGGWLGAQGPDPRDQEDFDLDPPVNLVPGELRAAGHTVESLPESTRREPHKDGCDARLPAPTNRAPAA